MDVRVGLWRKLSAKVLMLLDCGVGEDRRRRRHPTLVLLPGKSHGRRGLVGCSPWGCKESDTTERLHFHFSLSCIGEANGNPLQCSCLENPRDGGAWWPAVYGVAQSRTRLKWLSSSINSTNWKFSLPWDNSLPEFLLLNIYSNHELSTLFLQIKDFLFKHLHNFLVWNTY